MDDKEQAAIQERYQAAADRFVYKVKEDPNVIAVIICGSLAYDKVWEKSDIDMTLVVRDQNLKVNSYCISEDNITMNVSVVKRSDFKRYQETLHSGSFMQSYFSKAKILYTTDDSLYEYLDDNRTMGRSDMELFVFFNACEIICHIEKTLKWLTVKKNPLYAQYYLLKVAEPIARMEVCLQGELPTREAILQAMTYNPDVMAPFYQDAMSHHNKEEEIVKAIQRIQDYLEEHLDVIQKPVIEFMSDQELKTVTLITKHFHTDSHFIVSIFDYLVEKGVIDRVSQTIRITPKSKRAVEEIGYLYTM